MGWKLTKTLSLPPENLRWREVLNEAVPCVRVTCRQVCSSWQSKRRAWTLSAACYCMTVLEMWCKFRKTAGLDVFIKSFCKAESPGSKHRREGKIPEVWHGGRLCSKAKLKEEGNTLESELVLIYELLIQCPLKIHTPSGVSSGQARVLLRCLWTRRRHPARGGNRDERHGDGHCSLPEAKPLQCTYECLNKASAVFQIGH